jgi:4-hydroxy-tetrahydrodipicolinate synthase
MTGIEKGGDMARFHGVYPAIVTPLTEDREIDRDGTRKVVNYLIENGIHGISALGSTGECAGLSKAQRRIYIETVIEAAAGRVTVMSGANGTVFEDVVADLKMAGEVGAAAALTPPPFYYPLSVEAVIDYFEALAEVSPVPIFLYHIPRMTKVPIAVEAVEQLARHPNIAGLKDSDGNLAYFAEVARVANEVDDFSAFTGGDSMFYPSLVVGGHGIIGAGVNAAPAEEVAVYNAFKAGDHQKALKAQHALNPMLTTYRGGVFPAGVKATLAARGLCGTTMTRPIPSATADEVKAVRAHMESLGMLSGQPVAAD